MKNYLLISAVLMLAMSSCLKEKYDRETSVNPNEKWNTFTFSTEGETTVNVSYNNMGGISVPVYFEIYDTNPVKLNGSGSGYVKIDGIEPIFAGTTDDKGNFTEQVKLPAYLKKAYVYTPAFYAKTLIEASVEGGALTATDAEKATPATAAATRASYVSEAVSVDKWKTYLGTYDSTYGRINYAYTDKSEGLIYNNYSLLYTAHSNVINTAKACPEEYRSWQDLAVTEDAEIAVTFLGGNTCWNSSMGYYFYLDGQKPASLSQANVIMLFPNTQDGQWGNNISLSKKYKGVDRGTAVKLKYYPNINDKSSGTDVFPVGVRVGFVLATNAWTNRLSGFNASKKYRAATSMGLSVDNNGNSFQTPRTAVYRYINTAQNLNSVIVSFEDHIDDENFSDVVFTLISNPVKAIVVPPSVEGGDDQKQNAKILKGIYAFEDLWPSRGDYDMNDVMVKSNYEKVYNINKGIYEESFLFKTYNNIAGLENGLAVTLGGPAATSAKLSYSIKLQEKAGETTEFEPAEFTRDGNVVLITESVKSAIGATYKITATYNSPVITGGTAKPFIYSTTRDNLTPGKRWEVHLPFETPSDKVETYYFGRSEDRSDPAKGIYYVRQNLYPFAFFLSGATEEDLSGLLNPDNEAKAIDTLYPTYSGWAASEGKTNTDWYKK